MWDSLVELVQATIFAGAHLLGGSLGGSIVAVSAVVRLALTPLVLYSARKARAQMALLASIQPEVDRLKHRFKSDPVRLMTETQALHQRRGIRMSRGSMAATLVQMPLLGALFSAVRNGLGQRVRFLWIADLSRADGALILVATGVAGIAASLAPGAAAPNKVLVVAAMGLTLAFLWSASSAVALSVGAGSAVSMFQGWLIRRDSRRAMA